MKNKFEKTFKSDIFEVRAITIETMEYIKNTIPNISEDDKLDLKLILNELLFNSVIHGNEMDIIKNVNLTIEVDGYYIYASVSDEGAGYDYHSLFISNESCDDIMKESGRGIKLVSALADKIEFNQRGNSVKFCKRVCNNG